MGRLTLERSDASSPPPALALCACACACARLAPSAAFSSRSEESPFLSVRSRSVAESRC